MSVADGGQAFPRAASSDQYDGPPTDGMSLRDYFAASALKGMLAYSHVNPQNGNLTENGTTHNAAGIAYQYADAMLEAREKE